MAESDSTKPKRKYTPRGKRAQRTRATPQRAEDKAMRERRRAVALANLKKGAETRKRNEEERQIRELEAMQNRLALVIGDDQALAKARQRPQSIIDYCRENDLPEDIPYHPRYNLLGVPPDRPMQQVESIAFGRGWPSELGGLGGYGHLKNFVQMTWPDIEFNPWLEMCFRSLTDDEYAIRLGDVTIRFVSWTGPGSAGKTFCAGIFAAAWYLYDLSSGFEPRSSVTLTSTSKGIIAQRVWPVIQKAFHEARCYPSGEKLAWGHMIDSKKTVCGLRFDGTKDEKHSICAMAVESGELAKSLDKIKGRHTERMLLVVDEANSTPQAIFECIPNMLTSVKEIIILVIGNAGSHLDPHGLCCEPRRGWKSITIEDTQWDTKGVAKWGLPPGICIHFDGAKSPNVIAGRTEHKHIYSFERWQQVQRMGDEYRNTLQHWSQDRGFWPPDGIQTTVFSEAMVDSHDGTGQHHWMSQPRPCAALDPAFGGDDCQLQFGLYGEVIGNKKGVMLTESKLVPFDPESPQAIDFQIAQHVIKVCKERGIEPEMFGLDATGTGRGVAAFLKQMWSPRIHCVEFGGAASDLPASADDPRESHEVYANRVTELWYSCRDILVGDQLKGLFPEAIKQFCSRLYSYVNKRYKIEPKDDMKLRLGYSPDAADAIVTLIDVLRHRGLVAARTENRQAQLAESIQDHDLDALYDNAYGEPHSLSPYAEVL